VFLCEGHLGEALSKKVGGVKDSPLIIPWQRQSLLRRCLLSRLDHSSVRFSLLESHVQFPVTTWAANDWTRSILEMCITWPGRKVRSLWRLCRAIQATAWLWRWFQRCEASRWGRWWWWFLTNGMCPQIQADYPVVWCTLVEVSSCEIPSRHWFYWCWASNPLLESQSHFFLTTVANYCYR